MEIRNRSNSEVGLENPSGVRKNELIVSKEEIRDKQYDAIPFVSTVTNLYNIGKKVLMDKGDSNDIPVVRKEDKNYEYLNKKSYARCFVLAIPILGNILVPMYDYLSKKHSIYQITSNSAKLGDLGLRDRDDPDVVRAAYQHDIDQLSQATTRLRHNQAFIEEAIQHNPAALQHIPDDLQENSQFVHHLMGINGMALEHVSKDWLDHPEAYRNIVMEAVKQNGLALQFASEELRNDPEIVKTAVANNGLALEFVGEEIPNALGIGRNLFTPYQDIIYTALKSNPFALQFAGKMRNVSNVVNFAIKKNPLALEFAGEEFKKNTTYALLAVKKDGSALRFIDTQSIIEENPRLYKQMVRIALEQDPLNVDYVDRDFLKLPQNRDLVELAVKKNGLALQFLADFQIDEEIVELAIDQNPLAKEYARLPRFSKLFSDH